MNKLRDQAFSLVEITLAIGIVSFCLLSLLGLMPVGMDSVRDASKQAEAVRLLKLMATGIQDATQNAAGGYEMLGFGTIKSIAWEADGTPLTPVDGFLTAVGSPVATTTDADFVYRLDITPPDAADPTAPGHAMIRIAWPPAAVWSGGQWSKAQGSEEVLVIFRSR